MSDWISVTTTAGYRKWVRASAVISYGTMNGGGTYIDMAGRMIEVRESEAEIAELVGARADVLEK
jgi:hypothetical protein